MMTRHSTHRLAGIEPDNLLAFLALLGMLRSIEHARPAWYPRIAWSVDEPPVRPMLTVREPATEDEIVAVIAEGLSDLARRHEFGRLKNLWLFPKDASAKLREVMAGDRYLSDLWAALISDGAIRKGTAEPTPLCLLFGQGHMHFMSRLASVPQQSEPPKRGPGRRKIVIRETDCLHEALFETWLRPDDTDSFRWDPHEDVRYALRATDPTDSKTKQTTQHGANRLAAVGLSALTVVPRVRAGTVQLEVMGGTRKRGIGFAFTWPIWRHSISLATIRSLLDHTGLNRAATWDALGIVELRRARRISVGKYMNFTRAEPLGAPKPRRRVKTRLD